MDFLHNLRRDDLTACVVWAATLVYFEASHLDLEHLSAAV